MDWKSGNYVYPHMAMQLGGYADFWERLTGEKVEDLYIVQLGEDGYKDHLIPDVAGAGEAFYTACNLHGFNSRKWW